MDNSSLLKLKGSGHQQKSEENSQRIYCFGDFEVYGHNGQVKWATRKVKENGAVAILKGNGWVLVN